MGQISTYIPDELNDRVRATAKVKGWCISWVVKEALEDWLQNQPKARVDPCDWSAAMDEVETTLGSRIRTCPHCVGEECSH